MNAISLSPENNMAETAVPDRIIAGTSHSNSLTAAVQKTIRHHNILAYTFRLRQSPDCPENQTDVSCTECTVTYCYAPASVNINSIVIDHLLASCNVHMADTNIFTGNLGEERLKDFVGGRLASRIWNTSDVIEFVGEDRRGV